MTDIDELRKSVRIISFRGMVCSDQDLPSTYEAGWTWRVKVAGKYKGVSCDVDDWLVATVSRKGKRNQDSDFVVIGCCNRAAELAKATDKAAESLQCTIDALKAAQDTALDMLASFCRSGSVCPITANGTRCPHDVHCVGVTASHWRTFFERRSAEKIAGDTHRDEETAGGSMLDKLSVLF